MIDSRTWTGRAHCSWALIALACFACEATKPAAQSGAEVPAEGATPPPPAPAATTRDDAPTAPPAPETARVGEPAPDFTLKDLDGKTVRLSELKGKRVVLEWFNPQCPFVRASHTKGSLRGAADKAIQAGVVWLAINSAAPGKQGHAADVNRQAQTDFGMKYPILVDEAGTVGRAYGAERTPHMFVIDEQGVLVYQGAIDNSPDGEGASPQGGELVRYVDQALAELAAGRPVSVPQSKSYGCSVKFAD